MKQIEQQKSHLLLLKLTEDFVVLSSLIVSTNLKYHYMTQRDFMGREVGGGFMFGNACTPMGIHVNVWQNHTVL